jgi:hypothetical protein
MEAVTFELDSSATAVEIGPRTTYGTIVIVGGGCYGSYYVRQLRRGYAAGAIRWDSLKIVDRDPACRLAIEPDRALGAPDPDLVVSDWSDFFRDYFQRSGERSERVTDAIVPSPLMPHLMYEWLLERARERWPGRHVHSRALTNPPAVPWNRAGGESTHYVSFAEWMCPVNCVEPRLCPHTRGERSWSLPVALRAYVASENVRGNAMAGPVIFHCTHRAFGVGMIDTADVVEADRLVSRSGASGPVNILVGTVSHCHGALNLLSVGGTSL